ncbi:MAG: VWA domain-containing protein [Gammaproteobacteria bacterium]
MRIFLIVISALLASCGQPEKHNTGVYMLLDTSGTYRDELKKAEQIIYYTLAKLGPTDSFAVARIDTGSFSEKDIIVKATFENRPSAANGQKRLFADRVGDFARSATSAPYTDITGGLLQAIEFLNEKDPGHKTIFIFSDLKEDLQAGYVRDIAMDLDGFDVVALNVTKLRTDNVDPREYLGRLEDWETQVTESGGRWRIVNDLDHLEGLLSI